MLGVAVVGIVPLLFFAWHNRLGDFAKSPQTVEMGLGSTSIVAGGRAKLWFASVDLGPQVEVSCKKQSRLIELGEEPSDEVCGIRVRQMSLKEVKRGRFSSLRATFEVTWDDKTSQ